MLWSLLSPKYVRMMYLVFYTLYIVECVCMHVCVFVCVCVCVCVHVYMHLCVCVCHFFDSVESSEFTFVLLKACCTCSVSKTSLCCEHYCNGEWKLTNLFNSL